jgi:hypothetical protein
MPSLKELWFTFFWTERILTSSVGLMLARSSQKFTVNPSFRVLSKGEKRFL